MAKRGNPRCSQLVRGFLLGALYERGHTLTTARIRRDLRVSRATAKRDLDAIAAVVKVTPSKPIQGLREHQQRQARKAANS